MIETGKTVIVEWSPELDAVIKRLRKLGPDMRQTLFCTLQGDPYTESGFRSNWHRLMSTATKPGKTAESPMLDEPFTFHDLRAKSGSDADDVQEANADDLLAHDDLRTTQVIYRRIATRSAGQEGWKMNRSHRRYFTMSGILHRAGRYFTPAEIFHAGCSSGACNPLIGWWPGRH